MAEFLTARKGFVEGVVLSGGEPTFHPSLPDLLFWIRSMDYVTALHTNGYFPNMLSRLLEEGLVGFVAMDVKAPPLIYDRVTRVNGSWEMASRSIESILSSEAEYEFRTTYHPELLSEDDLINIIHYLHDAGATRYFIQRFQPRGVLDQELVRTGERIIVPETVLEEAENLFEVFEVR